MRIAQIANLSERVPPKKYGGSERVIYELTEELVHRGHDVTLFASGDSQTSARLISILPKSLRELNLKDPYGLNEWHFANINIAYQLQDDFDIIHDHNYILSTPAANLSRTPVVQTIHGCFHEDNIPLFSILDNIHLVAISYAQKKLAHNKLSNIAGVVYNGLSMDHYPFSKEHDGYLLFVGRMAMEKGVHRAIEVAKRLDIPLILGARVAQVDMDYFKEYIRDELKNPLITWIGEVSEEERNILMSRALCMLHPVTWPEPFGLTMIEAMACGCPVVGINNGSIAEIIEHGKTGFVVEDIDEMVEGVKKIGEIDRVYCRTYSLSTFNAKKMADGYEHIYKKVIEQRSQSTDNFEISSRRRIAQKIKKLQA